MSFSASVGFQRWIALGLIGFCALSVLIGLYDSLKPPSPKATTPAVTTSGQGNEGLSLIKNKVLKRDHLMLVSLRGMISSADGDSGVFSSESMAITARNALQEALETESVKGVLLWIDSPGGTVGMSQELYSTILKVSAKKPVVAYLGDVAASGGYYAASATDWIISTPGTLTGSIGVIISSMNLSGLLTDKLGIKPVVIKSGQFKDILSTFREATPAEIALIQDLINTSYKQFLGAVLYGRTRHLKTPQAITKRSADIKAIADGRIVIGEKAVGVGLVDEIGYFEDAKAKLNQLAIERFHLRPNTKLTLEEKNEDLHWLNALLTSSAAPDWVKATGLQHLLPMTSKGTSARQGHAAETLSSSNLGSSLGVRYPNQPLWVWQ
jgi:protease-4